ncbi:MAG: glycogen/starch synthase [Dysgonamonadaceae bacterium]|jgi:starch synthase|nr:glycogen/starch synthase [Dysgonamonadaceae bacterium]
MDAKRILFITSEIMPYLPETEISHIGRYLPQGIQEKGKEIRTFMPRFGNINERRNQLHEVIRLSGMNLIIDDTDHPLIIKVASIQSARMQIYFIDNEDFFQRKHTVKDGEGHEFEDNDERSIFYVRGVMETVKKLRWVPDLIHCHGWMTALAPLYIKKHYKDDPCFKNSKIVYSVYDDDFQQPFRDVFHHKLKLEGVKDTHLKSIKEKADFETLSKLAIDFSDGVIQGSPVVNANVMEYAQAKEGMHCLNYHDKQCCVDAFNAFYDTVLATK